jgi:PAS domain S-box-containing protein
VPERMAQVLLTALRRQRPEAGPPVDGEAAHGSDVTMVDLTVPVPAAPGDVQVEVTDPDTALAAVDAAVLTTLYGDSPVGIAVLDPTGRYLRINDLIARTNGPSPADHVGRTLEEVLGDSAPAVRAQLEQTLAHGRPVTGQDVVVLDSAGTARTWQVTWFPARDPGSGRIVAAVCVASDVTEVRRAELERHRAQERTRVLARSGELLAAGLRTEQVLDAVVALLVPGLGDWCVVHLVGPNGEIQEARAVHRDPVVGTALRRVLDATPIRRDQAYGAGRAIGQGRTQRMKDLRDEVLQHIAGDDSDLLALLRRLDTRDALSVPLRARGRTLGAVTVARSHELSEADDDLVEHVVRRAALALDNARLYEQQREVAVTLQRSLLPRSLPVVDGVALASRYLPGADGTEVGGDFYDAVALPAGRIGLTLGDVMGRGVRAAAVMGQLRATLRGYALENHPPQGVLARVDALVQALEDGELVTALYGVLDPVTGALAISSAGHPPPLVVAADGAVRALDLDPGPPLGVDVRSFGVAHVTLAPGDTLLLFTDGLVEDRSLPVYEGIEKLVAGLAGHPLIRSGDPDAVCAAALAVMGRGPSHDDDIALLAVTLTP